MPAVAGHSSNELFPMTYLNKFLLNFKILVFFRAKLKMTVPKSGKKPNKGKLGIFNCSTFKKMIGFAQLGKSNAEH